jgi:hypothetical protein
MIGRQRDPRPWRNIAPAPLPPERPGYFQWRPLVEPIYGPQREAPRAWLAAIAQEATDGPR